MMLVGSMANLVGDVAKDSGTVKADASVDVSVKAKATIGVGAGTRPKGKSKPSTKTVAKSKAVATKTTNVKTRKETKAMNSINVVTKNVRYGALSLLGAWLGKASPIES
jgi:hypothetical protein